MSKMTADDTLESLAKRIKAIEDNQYDLENNQYYLKSALNGILDIQKLMQKEIDNLSDIVKGISYNIYAKQQEDDKE